MRLPNSAHSSCPWRIHAMDPSRSPSPALGALFAIRWKIGEVLGFYETDDEWAAEIAKKTMQG